jgi:Zn-dependent protease with chaperone function
MAQIKGFSKNNKRLPLTALQCLPTKPRTSCGRLNRKRQCIFGISAGGKSNMMRLFTSHAPTPERIEALQRMG